MSETSSGSVPSCSQCHVPLPAPDASFCGRCGTPQQEMKNCIQCRREIPRSDRYCYHCRQDQTQPLTRKPCLLCGAFLPSISQLCVFCSAPQDPQVMPSVHLKYCVNYQVCGAVLMYSSTLCHKCKLHQPMPTPIKLLIKAEPSNTQMAGESSQLPPVYPSVLPSKTFMEQTPGGQSFLQTHVPPDDQHSMVVSDQGIPAQNRQLIPIPQHLPSMSSHGNQQYQMSQYVDNTPQFSSHDQSHDHKASVNETIELPGDFNVPLTSQSCVTSHPTSTHSTVSYVPTISDQEKAIHGAKRQLENDECLSATKKRHKSDDLEDDNNSLVYTEKGGAVVCQQVPNESLEPNVVTNSSKTYGIEGEISSHTANTETELSAKNADINDTNDREISPSTVGNNNAKHKSSEYESTTIDHVVPTLADIVKKMFPWEANTTLHHSLSQQEEVMKNSPLSHQINDFAKTESPTRTEKSPTITGTHMEQQKRKRKQQSDCQVLDESPALKKHTERIEQEKKDITSSLVRNQLHPQNDQEFDQSTAVDTDQGKVTINIEEESGNTGVSSPGNEQYSTPPCIPPLMNNTVDENVESGFVIVEPPKGDSDANNRQETPSSHTEEKLNDQERNTTDQTPSGSSMSSSPLLHSMNTSSNQTSNTQNKPLEQTTTPKATIQSSQLVQTVKSEPIDASYRPSSFPTTPFRPDGDILPEGLRPSKENSMRVIFKAIVPVKAWEWDEKSSIYIRFGPKTLGEWKYDYGPGEFLRDAGNGLFVFDFNTNMDIRFLKQHVPIPYKYIVYSKHYEEVNHPYEYLHGAAYATHDPNRCLLIPSEKFILKRYYRQFDTLVLPATKEKPTFVSKTAAKVTKWISDVFIAQDSPELTKNHNKFEVPEANWMRQESLEIHLQPTKKIFLEGDYYPRYDISYATDGVVNLFDCSYHQHISVGQRQFHYDWTTDSVRQGMKEWLENITDELVQQEELSLPKRLAAATNIICCIDKLLTSIKDIKEDTRVALIEMVALSPSGEDYDYLKSLLKTKLSQDQVLNAVTGIIKYLSQKKKKEYTIHIIKSLPLIHFLRRTCSPFENVAFNPANIVWEDSALHLEYVKLTMIYLDGFIKDHITELQDLFSLDPYLICSLLYVCPRRELPLLCGYVPLGLMFGIMGRNIPNYTASIESWKQTEINQLLMNPLKEVQQTVLQRPFESIGDVFNCLEGVNKLLEPVKSKLQSASENDKLVVKALSAVLLSIRHSINILHTRNEDENAIKLDSIKKCSDMIKSLLKNWIVKSNVIGGSMFGGGVSAASYKTEAEIKVWEFMLLMQFGEQLSTDFILPVECKAEWHAIITFLVNARVAEVPKESRVDLFCDLENRKDTPDILTNLFMTHAAKALDELIFNQNSHYNLRSIERLQSTKSKRVVRLFGNLLKKKYPNFQETNEVPFSDLLEWDLWPGFIKIYENYKAVVNQETENSDWSIICSCAVSQFESMCTKICNGNVTMGEMKYIQVRQAEMSKLCHVATTSDKKEVPSSIPSFSKLKKELANRLKEFQFFTDYKNQILQFVTQMCTLPFKGQADILVQLRRNYQEDSISHLCQTATDGKCVVTCFSFADPLKPYLSPFNIISSIYPSDLFNKFWQDKLTELGQTKGLVSFHDITELVWKPVFKRCQMLLSDLKSWKLKLHEVDQLFKERYYEKQKALLRDITNLSQAVNKCQGIVEQDSGWIKDATNRISQYWNLCNYHEAAQAFIKIRDTLGLTGNFSLVERVAKQASVSMSDQTLESIDQSVVEASKFLKAYVTDAKKRKCLEAFADCQKIVEWIRNETKDVNDLQNFVNIALATAAGGEGDLTTDKLSHLRTVGSGFGPLIYKLPKTAGYQKLQENCKTLWDTLKQAPDLPKIMRSCEQEIDWYQSVKETQGSVEKTSFGQMRNINQYGRYEIGSLKKGILFGRSETIHLELRHSKQKKIAKLQYTLNELRDLESKLVLITGRESKERKEVDVFLDTFHSVCRIADNLISLRQHGNSEYMGWAFSFFCSSPNVVVLLNVQSIKMENDLENWMKEVEDRRSQFYELNYFTTPQLLSLCEELGQFKCVDDQHKPIKSEVMTLLQSISREVTTSNVKEQVQIVCAILQEQSLAKEQLLGSRNKSPSIPLLHHSNAYTNLTTQAVEYDIHYQRLEIHNDNNGMFGMSRVFEDIMKTEVASNAPEPQLKYEELTDKQKAIIANLKEENGFHTKLIMLAFDRCAKPDTEEEVEDWCLKRTEDFVYPDSEADSDAMTEPYFDHSDDDDMPSEDERDEEEEEAVKMDEDTPIEAPPMEIEPDVRQKPVKVKIIERIPVDENHPDVIELHNTGFDLDLCIEATKHYPHDISLALDYLNERSDQGKLFEASLTVHEIGLEESTDEYERQDSRGSDISPTNEEVEIIRTDTSAKTYLPLRELGMVLHQLSEACKNPVSHRRTVPEGLKVGEYNLLVVPPENVLKSTLSLYKNDTNLPMPTYEEVLLCNEQTTDEEVTLLWKRALGDPNNFRIFCLVHAEKLSYQTCDKALRDLQELSQGKKDYRLVIICSNEDEDKSHMVSKLQLYRRPLTTVYSDQEFAIYLKNHFISWSRAQSGSSGREIWASEVDPDKSYVRVVTSERAGMGKSLYIHRMKELLASKTSVDSHEIIIPIHGPKVTTDTIVEALKGEFSNTRATIFHLDISPSVLWQVDSILFSLLVLQAICDSQGRIWRCHPAHLYTIEVTIPKSEQIPAKRTIALLNILPSIKCVSPRVVLQMMKNSREDAYVMPMDDKEFNSSMFQRVFQYLQRHIAHLSLDRFMYAESSVEGTAMECLVVLLGQCGVEDPSWGEIKHFVCFLDTQLRSCENSDFCDEDIVGDVMSGLKTFAVKFMVRMSKDFATSSLKGEVAAENEEEVEQMEDLQEYQIDERKQWEQNYHPYLFFNDDGMSITFVGFNANRNGDLLDPVRNQIIERTAMTRQLYTGLQENQVNLSENYQTWDKGIMIQKIGMVMGLEWMTDPDPSYVLTVDNVIKILAIHMRFRCNIPVVIMGETGCGKTRLIRFMCDLAAEGCRQGGAHVRNMLIMKVHGGTTEADIIKKVKDAENVSVENRNTHKIDTVLFFDEANTTEAVGLIKEVMCDRRINGRPVAENVKFIAACNPYKKHTEEMIEKLESAGLGFYVKATETQQKLGKIPLRQLVYRVLDLPPSMRPLVYDFGQLNNATERDYTRQIVKGRCSAIADVTGKTNIIEAVTRVLAWNQSYMRNRKDECSFVSLRDVERTMIVFRYFCEKADKFQDLVAEKAEEEMKQATDAITRALILSLSVCYHARLQDREEYEEAVVNQFRAPLALPQGREQFCDEMRWCQDVLLGNMKLGPNIARNAALRENVFMMAVCIELRIPLFLVGKPGSSKSLAKSIVADSMLGRFSEKPLLKEFKEVHMFSYQCSQLSTPESVIEVFNTAKSFQKKQDTANYVSVVVLDEVGLAEDSPNLPLKALHPLLEDGTAGGDDSQQIIDRQQRVAFIGISNWALDPAKMNRGVMVTRGDPDEDELELSARGICSNRVNDPVKERLDPYFRPLAAAYKNICEEQDRRKRAFFGLRDFYSLIKMLYWMCEKSICPPTGPQLEHAIKRNFGGLDSFNTYEIFMNYLANLGSNLPDLSNASEEERETLHPDCTPLGLIKTSLRTKEITWHGENRYLLFLTENYAALQVLKHYLLEVVGLSSNVPISAGLEEDMGGESIRRRRMEPFVLFGSSFPKDREYTQVCRNINQIKICMETGRTVILLNLENLYESLYDLLNQYYIVLGGTRYVDLGLQTHRVKCRVHNDFKLILIAEKGTVYEKFPTPLINRLEKHFVLTETVLLDWQKEVLIILEKWVKQFSTVTDTNSSFKTQDAFVGFQNDTPASVIFQATEQLKTGQYIEPDYEETEECRKDVFKCSCEILLQMASPDALIRLERTVLAEEAKKLSEIYFSDQCHGSIVQFLQHHLQTHTVNSDGLLIQVTTHSHLLSNVELTQLYQCIEIEENLASCFLLQEFDTELDFSNKVSPAFSRDPRDKLLIIQCDSGHLYGDLIACARYRVDDEREKARLQRRPGQGTTHVLFIIHLPRRGVDKDKESSSFVGFQGGAWISAHIDDIRAPAEAALTLDEALSAPISELFYNMPFTSNRRVLEPVSRTGNELEVEEQRNEFSCLEVEDIEMNVELYKKENGNEEEALQQIESDLPPSEIIGLEFIENEQIEEDVPVEEMEEDFERSREEREGYEGSPMDVEPQHRPMKQHNQCYRLYHCIQAAVAKIAEKDVTKKEWTAHHIRILLDLIPQNPQFPLDDQTFYGALVKQIVILLKERDSIINDRQWVLNEALNGRNLQSGGTFQNVLSRRIDEVIIPVFSAILSFVDRYSNLDLLRNRGEPTPLQCLWLQIFTNEKLCRFSYDAIAMGRSEDILPGGQQHREDFSCQFPFFWLIKEAIDSNWDNAKGGHEQQVHKQLCELLEDDPVAVVLREVDISHWEELYQLYLHDFLRSVHRVHHHMTKEEYEIIGRAIQTIVAGPDLTTRSPSLLSRLVAVHVAYQDSKKEIMWFGQITSHIPGILTQLGNAIEQYNQHMELHLHAVKVAMQHLTLPLDKDVRKHIPSRLIKIQLCQNAIDSILTLSQDNEMVEEIRCAWHSVRVIQLFVEHLVMKYEDLVKYARRIMLYMKKNSDFTKASTIENVQKTLRVMDGELEKKKEYKPVMQEIREHCKSFFMEVVSSLCFGQPELPEPALIHELLTLVFTEKDKTKEFSYSDKIKTDRVPVIRSFLLQLLLEHNTDDVKRYLDDYISKSRHIIKDDQNLCLLCIQCLEDAIYKQYSHLSLQERIPHTQQLLHEGFEALRTHPNPSLEENINLAYLEGVAKLRFAKCFVAEFLHCRFEGKGKGHYSHEAQLFLEAAKRCCEDEIVNVEDAGPGIFLVKQIVRQYGMTFLMNLISDRSMEWVVPVHLRRSEEEQQTSDPFVIYNPIYGNIRKQLTDAVYGMEVEEMQHTLGKLTTKEAVPYMLALYQVVTLSHVHVDEVKMVKDEAKTMIDKFTKKCSFLNRELMWAAQSLIQNTHCENLEPMLPTPRQNPQNRILADVIVHAAIVFNSNSALKILQPFVKILNTPGDLKRAYLPTMPDDSLPEVRQAMGRGQFYECPRGHPYFVSECGQPMQEYSCRKCGSRIGGQNHTLNPSNRVATTNDTTQTGYCLGEHGQREALPTPERTLSPAACAILRALMHCSLVWTSCNNETATEGLLDLIYSQVRPREMPKFFWQHLEHDINILSCATGKSKDEACLLLHLVLRDVMMKNPVQSSGMDTYLTLHTKEAREKWEKCFNDAYVQPILVQLDKSLHEATQQLLNDKKEDEDHLFYMVYERVSVSPNTILPHLWSYRSRITLEHLSQTLSTQKYPILNEFLKKEPILRATQYIPGIVQLQQQLHDLYHRRLDKTEAAQITVGDFVRGLKIEHKKRLFRKKLNCVKTAWTLVKEKLPEYARVRIPAEYVQKITWDDSLPLSYLIPTLTGPGVCTVALVDLLVGAHNEFMETCRSELKKKQNTEWRKHKIPVSHIQQCHLLDYEHHLLSIVLSHCHYSLRHGKGQDVTYDYPALEKHLVDRFIHGKPLIQLEIPQVLYRKDVYSAMTFANIRKKVKPQVKLSDQEQKDINNELRTPQDLRDCLDDVEIIIGFLSSGGGDANIELRKYVKRALKMEDRFKSKKALEYCHLGHILSLWETLSVQMSRNLTLAKQEPFDSLNEIFLQPLQTKDEGGEDQIGELNRFLRGIDLSLFLNLLYEFIETTVRHFDPQNKDWPLLDTLEAHLDQNGLDPLNPDIAKTFPVSITVSQAVATWKAVVFYQQN